MKEDMTVKYEGIEISYIEERNVWLFELRGRERSAESLAKAKEAIDKSEPKEKKPFTRIAAYLKDYSAEFEAIEVTSIAEPGRYGGGPYVWISRSGTREKKSADDVYLKNPGNDRKIAEWAALETQRGKLTEEMQGIIASMEVLKVEP